MAVMHQEWLNQNSYRAYPIREDCTRYAVDEAGAQLPDVQIPNALFADLVLTVAGTPTRYYISKVAYIGKFLSFEIMDQAGNPVITAAIPLASHVPFASYPLIGLGEYEDARGAVVIGDTSKLSQTLPEGSFEFSLVTAELEPSTVRPDLRGVRSLQGDYNGNVTSRLFGHVRLVAGDNIRLTLLPDENAIRIDAIEAGGFSDECECVDDFTLPCIKSINGIAIEDVRIVGDNCIEVTPSGNELVLTDRCSQPCCGCIELEFLTKNMDLLEDQLSRLEGYADQMRERLVQFITNVLVSI
jgi:hypothetical protein